MWEHTSSYQNKWTDTAVWRRTADQEEAGHQPGVGVSRTGPHVWETLGYQGRQFLYHQASQSRYRHMKEGKGVPNAYGLTAF